MTRFGRTAVLASCIALALPASQTALVIMDPWGTEIARREGFGEPSPSFGVRPRLPLPGLAQ
jgi:hypothetical protein